MKKIALLALLSIALLSTTPSHAMRDFNPETKAFFGAAHNLANTTGNAAYMHRLREGDLTPLQEFLSLSAPEKTSPTVWIFINTFLKQMLKWDASAVLVNPQTGNTPLGDLIIHCHPTNNYIHHMTEDLIKAGARLDNIDSQGNSFGDLLAKARESGVLTPNQYNDIITKPAVQQHIAQQRQERQARFNGISDALGDFLLPELHVPITQYECNFPE